MDFDNSRYRDLPSGFELIEKLAKDFYTPDTVRRKGPFLAKVLRVEQTNSSDDDGVTWLDELDANFKSDSEEGTISPFENLLRLKVHARIDDKLFDQPFIHAGIPEPTQVGNSDVVSPENDLYILQHHQFISLNETAASLIPSPGDYVWVDFLDKQTYTKPVYLSPLKGIVGGNPGVPPCGPSNSAQSTYQQAPPKGGALKSNSTNDPSKLKGRTVGGKGKTGKQYKLYGYVASDFTKQKKFLKEPYISNMERMISAVEVMHWYLEQLYPGKKIKIYDPKAAITWGHVADSAHKWGVGLDFKAKIDGKRLNNTTAWAIIFRLIMSGKIPDGGVGFYQTATGPNAGKSTTWHTNLPPSGCPHYNPETLTDDPKCPRPGGYKTKKWFHATVKGKKIERLGAKTAAGQLKKPQVPRYALQRYNKLQEPAADMPTWEEVKKTRAALAASSKPVSSVKVEAKTPTPPTPKSTEKPEEKKKKTEEKPTTGSEPKKEDKKKNENKKKEDQKTAKKDDKNKKSATENKAKTDAKKEQAAKISKPTPPTKAPASQSPTTTNCTQNTNGGGGGGSSTGSNQGPPGTMKVLPGSAIKLPKAKKPKGLYSNSKVTNNIYADPKDKGRLQHVQMFVCHETGPVGNYHTSYKIARNRAAKIQKQKMVKKVNKKTGQIKYKQYDSWRQVHFWGGGAGDIAMTTPLNSPCAHATWTNWHSLGYEVINKVFVGKNNKTTSDPKNGYRVLGPNGCVGGDKDFVFPDGTKQKGTGVIRSKIGVEPGTGHYCLPTEIQCRRLWETIVWCSLKIQTECTLKS